MKRIIIPAIIVCFGLVIIPLATLASPTRTTDYTFLWDQWYISNANGKVSSLTYTASGNTYDLYATWTCNTTFCQGDNGFGRVHVPLVISNTGGLTTAPITLRVTWYPDGAAAPQLNWQDTFTGDNALILYASNGQSNSWSYVRENYVVTATTTMNISTIGELLSLTNWRGIMPNPSATYSVHAKIEILDINGESVVPTATPTPISFTATPAPQGALPCVDVSAYTSPTVQATQTPYGPTRTPTKTPTPGGPTSTPGPTATARPTTVAGFDSGLLDFAANVSALQARGNVNGGTTFKFLRWSNVTGYDGDPGAAWMHTDAGTFGPADPISDTMLLAESGLVVYPLTPFRGPVAVSLYARAAYTIETGLRHWVRVWWLDPNYDGQGTAAWYSRWDQYTHGVNSIDDDTGGFQVSNTWRKFGIVISPTAGSGTIAAIAFDDYWSYSDEPHTGSDIRDPCPTYGCVYVDDIRIAYGPSAGMALEACDGSSSYPGGDSTTTRGSKTCIVNITEQDLRAVCKAPTSLDLGAWLSYLWCNIWRFFGFFQENRDQVDAILVRQGVNEPFGSLIEFSAISDDLATTVDDLKAASPTTSQTTMDFVQMFVDGSALDWDRLASFSVPDMAGSAAYMAGCSQAVIDVNVTMASGACMAIYMMRQTIIITFLQWALNALFVVGILMMVRNALEKLAA